ncbi:MAG: HlyD family efflux transporter periplasmic adaptor subunit [Planctomycetota bacterium]|nr:HlyD family efflux transporter periplasmic adaptor subunit [Planctomycetota bacterium]
MSLHFPRLPLPRRGSAKAILILIVALATCGLGGYAWWQSKGSGIYSASKDEPILHEVQRGPFDHIVLEQGEIESSSNNEVKCEVKGRGGSGTPILSLVAEGIYVKKGDKLCQLDSSALEQDVKNQRIVVSTVESNVINSEAAVSKAAIAKQEYLEGTYLTERSAILSEIALAEQGLRKAELSLESAERLAVKGVLKALQIESEQYALSNAKSNLVSANGKLRVLDNLTKEKMLVQLNSDIETARAKLDSDKSTLVEEKEKLEEIKGQIKACAVVAPADGQVVYANKQGSRGGSDFTVTAGALVREQQTIFLLPDPTRMQVKAKVNESRITLIRDGMPVKINVGAAADELLGRVIKVNKYAEQGNMWGPTVKEYVVIVQIIEPPQEIRTGMTAEVRIFVEQIADAVQLPVHAVYETKKHHFALVKNGNAWDTREIKIGATNDKYVTVVDGVDVQDMVVLDPRNHLDKMEIPVIAEVDDREKLVKIAAESPKGAAKSGPEARGAGGPPGGPPGGAGGMNAESAAAGMLSRMDTNGDGKVSAAEVADNERMKNSFADYDTNKDGSIDLAEMVAQFQKRMAAGGAGGGGPGGGGGSGASRGAPSN